MLALATFVTKLSEMAVRGFRDLKYIRKEDRKTQGEYLDCISAALASAGVAIGEHREFTKELAELRYHLGEIEDVLRMGDPRYLMAVSDDTVAVLRNELDAALRSLELAGIRVSAMLRTPDQEIQLRDLQQAFFNAAGLFRGAAVSLKGRIK